MPFEPQQLNDAILDVFGAKPHPDLPELKVHEYPAFARVAARMFGSKQPDPEHVSHAYHTLTNLGLAPAEFERVWDVARPLANHLLDRDPTPHDLAILAGQMPADMHAYYMDHPHPEHPTVKAGDMAVYHQHAQPISQRLAGRDPNLVEVARFASGQYSMDDIVAHYQDDGTTLAKRNG